MEMKEYMFSINEITEKIYKAKLINKSVKKIVERNGEALKRLAKN